MWELHCRCCPAALTAASGASAGWKHAEELPWMKTAMRQIEGGAAVASAVEGIGVIGRMDVTGTRPLGLEIW